MSIFKIAICSFRSEDDLLVITMISNKLSDHLCLSRCISFGSKPNHCFAFVKILKLQFDQDFEVAFYSNSSSRMSTS